MTAFRRMIVALLCLIMAATTASPCAVKPTREQIIAFAQRCKNEKKRMDLVAEFGGDFAGLDLSGVDFRGCHAVHYETNLRSADFSNCNLHRAEFGAAILDDADFTGANLERATFVTASLKQATLLRVSLKGTQFYQTNLSGAKLTRADFSSADITGSNFGGADLSDAILAGAKNDYWWNDFSHANLTLANLSGLRLKGASFRGAILRTADLSGTDLTQADFTGADLTEASLKDAHVESAVFRNAQGLNHAERSRLERQSQRWKFELKTGVASVLKAMYFPAYASVVLAIVGLSIRVVRLPDRPPSVVVAAAVNLLTFVPAFVLFCMCLLGASATVQFNVGNPAAMELWSAWVGLWPLFMLTLLSCLGVTIVTALVFLVSCWRQTVMKRSKSAMVYIALTVVHCLFATHWVGSNFPDA